MDAAVVGGGCEHRVHRRVPVNRVDSARVSLQLCQQLAAAPMPDIHLWAAADWVTVESCPRSLLAASMLCAGAHLALLRATEDERFVAAAKARPHDPVARPLRLPLPNVAACTKLVGCMADQRGCPNHTRSTALGLQGKAAHDLTGSFGMGWLRSAGSSHRLMLPLLKCTCTRIGNAF